MQNKSWQSFEHTSKLNELSLLNYTLKLNFKVLLCMKPKILVEGRNTEDK